MSYEEKIRQEAPKMSRSFIHLADFLLNSYIDASLMTANEIATILNLDAATVVRFAQSLGYSGFPQLQREIQDRVKRDLSHSASEREVARVAENIKSYPYEEKIRLKRSRMSNRFSLLADFLLDSKIDASFMTASEIGKTLDIDAATVVRFAQFIGYSGFAQLRSEVQERTKDYLLHHLKESDVSRPKHRMDVLINRASADSEKLTDPIPLQKILSQQVEAIQAHLQGRGTTQVSDEKLCDWVQFCYIFELYSEGSELFSLVSEAEVNPWYFERTKRIARVCEQKMNLFELRKK